MWTPHCECNNLIAYCEWNNLSRKRSLQYQLSLKQKFRIKNLCCRGLNFNPSTKPVLSSKLHRSCVFWKCFLGACASETHNSTWLFLVNRWSWTYHSSVNCLLNCVENVVCTFLSYEDCKCLLLKRYKGKVRCLCIYIYSLHPLPEAWLSHLHCWWPKMLPINPVLPSLQVALKPFQELP